MTRRHGRLPPIVVAILLANTVACHDQRELIAVAARQYVTQQSGISDVEINVEKVDGDYARVSIKPRDPAKADPGWVFLKRENGTWRGLAIGTDFSSDDLKQRGIPISLQP
jgi:hypothetical protein